MSHRPERRRKGREPTANEAFRGARLVSAAVPARPEKQKHSPWMRRALRLPSSLSPLSPLAVASEKPPPLHGWRAPCLYFVSSFVSSPTPSPTGASATSTPTAVSLTRRSWDASASTTPRGPTADAVSGTTRAGPGAPAHTFPSPRARQISVSSSTPALTLTDCTGAVTGKGLHRRADGHTGMPAWTEVRTHTPTHPYGQIGRAHV